MELYLIRHADAVPAGANGVAEDSERPLTDAGRAQCEPLARALLRQHVGLERIVTSPYLRARQTADGLREHWSAPAPELVVCEALAPGGRRRKLARFLRDLGMESVALVGHNPDLSVLAAWLIGGKTVQVELAKAGVARIECDSKPGKGAGVLTWMVTPEWCEALQEAKS
jgi:phosphohistidine phosphatase